MTGQRSFEPVHCFVLQKQDKFTNIIFSSRAGTVQASALGRTPMRAVREYNLTPTDEQRGLHGLQHFNQPLYEELTRSSSSMGVQAAMHQTAQFLRSRSAW